ncbi:MAG: DeoR/GlpR family DNA-binding transcription regulator [Suipraeoptans sp.]
MEERRQKIIEILTQRRSMKVQELIEELDGSPATIRRDLTYMEQNHIVTRSRGYVKIIKHESAASQHFTTENVVIGKAVADIIEDDSTVLVDSGSTALACAYQLVGKSDMTLVTNSVAVINAMSNVDIMVNVTGGYLNGPQEALLGPEAERYIEAIKVKYCVLGTTGTRLPEGLTCVTPFQASIKSCMIKAAEIVILAVDSSKFQKDALIQFGKFKDLNYVVTDKPLNNKEFEEYLEKNDVKLIIG